MTDLPRTLSGKSFKKSLPITKDSADEILAEIYEKLEKNHDPEASLIPSQQLSSAYGPESSTKHHKKKKKRKSKKDEKLEEKNHKKTHKHKKASKKSKENKNKRPKKSKKSRKEKSKVEAISEPSGLSQDDEVQPCHNDLCDDESSSLTVCEKIHAANGSGVSKSQNLQCELISPKKQHDVVPVTSVATISTLVKEGCVRRNDEIKIQDDESSNRPYKNTSIELTSTNSDQVEVPKPDAGASKSKAAKRLVIGLSEKTKIILAEQVPPRSTRRPVLNTEDGEIMRSDYSMSDGNSPMTSLDGSDVNDDDDDGVVDSELRDENDQTSERDIPEKFRSVRSSVIHRQIRSHREDYRRRSMSSSSTDYRANKRLRRSPSPSLSRRNDNRRSHSPYYSLSRRIHRSTSREKRKYYSPVEPKTRSRSRDRRFYTRDVARRSSRSPSAVDGGQSRYVAADRVRHFRSPALDERRRRRSRTPPLTQHRRAVPGVVDNRSRGRRWRLGDDKVEDEGGRTPPPKRQYYRRERSRSGSQHRPNVLPKKTYVRREKWRLSQSPEGYAASLLGIDKAELLSIAKRNASAMLQQGTLQKICSMGSEEIAKLKAGGTSVDQLVEYCKKLQKKQIKAEERSKEMNKSGSDSDSSCSKASSKAKIHHPFALNANKPSNIVFNIKNVTQIPVKTPAERAVDEGTLRIAYPVSSGQQHRTKESEWVPVSPPRTEPVILVAEKRHKTAADSKPTSLLNSSTITSLPLPPPPAPPPVPPTPPIAHASLSVTDPSVSDYRVQSMTSATAPVTSDSVFEDFSSGASIDIGEVVASRLKAIKRLYENPNDAEALKMMQYAEQMMRKWADSKNVPGAFIGGTGVQCLTPDQLAPKDPKFQAWTRKDQLIASKPVQSGVGMALLQTMGWKPGEGLGKNKEGTLKPLLLDIKSGRKGLVSNEELLRSKPQSSLKASISGSQGMPTQIFAKHPVSALMELCSKRRWHPPSFTCLEQGASHSRRFLWKVLVNGVEYQPAVPSGNKKQAKLQAAQVAIQSLGLAPRDPSLPIVIG